MIDAYSNAPEWGSKFLNDTDHVRYLYYLNWILHVCVCVCLPVCVPHLSLTLTLKSLSHIRLFVTPWTVAYQAPLSMEFSRQEYCSGLPSQSCPILWDCMNCSLPGSSVHGILPARIQDWVAISFSRGSSWPRDLLQHYLAFIIEIVSSCHCLPFTKEYLRSNSLCIFYHG